MGGEEQTSVPMENNGGQYNQGINLRKFNCFIYVILLCVYLVYQWKIMGVYTIREITFVSLTTFFIFFVVILIIYI